VRRGEIWWVGLPAAVRSEPGYRRPMLIVSSNDFNESAISTLICAAITSNIRLAEAPGNVLVRRRESGLARDSVVNVSQVATVDKRMLGERVGLVSTKTLHSVEAGLRLALSL
jgi:mRNA interferase MazF